MIIDIHTHLFAENWIPDKFFKGMEKLLADSPSRPGRNNMLEEPADFISKATSDPQAIHLLHEMNKAGIDTSIIFPVDFGLALGEPETGIEEINRSYARLAQKQPDKLIAFAGIDPRRKNALHIFTRCIKEWGMKGLKLHPATGFYPTSRETYMLLEKACQWHIPVIVHTGCMTTPLKSKYSQALWLDDMAADFPELRIIAAHAGGVLNYSQMLSIMAVKPNILADISAWQIMAVRDYPRFCKALRDLMNFGGHNRILFGSDSPSLLSIMSNSSWVKTILELPEKAPQEIKFSPEEIKALLGSNARALLEI